MGGLLGKRGGGQSKGYVAPLQNYYQCPVKYLVANSAYPDQMSQNAASDNGLH